MNRFRLLLSGQAMSSLGDILYILALVTTLYRQSGSAAVAALFPLLRVIGMTLGSFGAPLVLGKFRLARLLAGCLLLQTAGLTALALYLNATESPRVEGLTAVVFVLSLLEGVAAPVRSSLLPRIVEKDKLLKANGTLGAVIETCSLAGWTFGAIVIVQAGAAPSLWASAFLLLLSGMAAMGIWEAIPAPLPAISGETGKSLLAGWRTILRVPTLRLVLWMSGKEYSRPRLQEHCCWYLSKSGWVWGKPGGDG
jgi:DHA3 family macrolide efflux protein-like MFS transporter